MQNKNKKRIKKSPLLIALTLSASLFVVNSAIAIDNATLPENGNIVSGSINLEYTDGNRLNIYQGSDRAIINWDSFNIGSDAVTEFFQPGANSIAVNRVVGNGVDPTRILGHLKSNGKVMIMDGNGIIFGKDSLVDVNGIVATTGNINDQQFMSGGAILDITSINTGGAIVNDGTITIESGGLAAFVAPTVQNNGVINARMGRVSLAAGDAIALDLYGDGLVEIATNDELSQALIENNGTINAQGGYVQLSVPQVQNVVNNIINMNGIIEASSATEIGGKIVLGGGNINIAGSLKAQGKNGGGTIHVGGEYLGGGDTLHAQKVSITADALIDASAVDKGNGGEIIVWSDQETTMAGQIKATGGATSGNGGFIETSSKEDLYIRGRVDASSVNGKSGQWLLDPSNVSIVNSSGFNASAGGLVNPTTDSYTVDADTIQTALNGGTSVTITTTNGGGTEDGNITMTNSTINKTSGSDALLTLKADNSITLTNSTISSTAGELGVTLHADSDNNDAGYIHINNTDILTNGGDFIAGGGVNPLTDYAWGTAILDDGVTIDGGSTITTESGNIYVRGHGRNSAGTNNLTGISITDNSSLSSTLGLITLNGVGGNGEDQNQGIYLNNLASITSVDGDIFITALGGSDGNQGDNNYGIYARNSSEIKSTGTGINAANITVNATGGAGRRSNIGFYGQGLTMSTVDGDFTIVGLGGGDGTNQSNVGIQLVNSTTITSTGTGINAGTITLDGTGGAGSQFSHGVFLNNSSVITSTDGDINITGTAGSSTGQNNVGIYFSNGFKVISNGSGVNAAKITLDGTGANGNRFNYGIHVRGNGTEVKSIDGDITITGEGNSSGADRENYGFYLESTAKISSSGTGTDAAKIEINGTGGNGTHSNHGIYLKDAGSQINSADGGISIMGQARGSTINNNDIQIDAADILTTNSDIQLTGDTYNIVNVASVSSAKDTVILSRTEGASIGLGSGAGTLNLDNTELNLLDATGEVRIGDATSTSIINIDNADISPSNYNLNIIGGELQLDNNLTGGARISLQSAQGDITLNSGTIFGSGAGNTVVIDVKNDFVNNVGALAIDPDTGRYLIYAPDFEDFNPNGLTASNIYNKTQSSLSPASVTGTDNKFIFANGPVTDTKLDSNFSNSIAKLVSIVGTGVSSSNKASDVVENINADDENNEDGIPFSSSCLAMDAITGTCLIK